ncbi:MAG: hypothetical protein AAFR88_09155 [Pseudomonadota bacterium]
MPRLTTLPLILAAAFSLASCASTGFTGPVEVTRFVAESPAGLGRGTIALRFSDDLTNETARSAFRASIGNELGLLGYTVVGDEAISGQVAIIDTRRTSIPTSEAGNPVSVGVGGSTGSFGSGVGVGIGIDLGADRRQGPNFLSRLSVRISETGGETLWEGRAQQPVSLKSPYAPVDASAATLAKALFRDFPGGNGETITIDVDELQD